MSHKVTLQHVRLNSGGYTDSGHYYGTGQRLYWFCLDDGGNLGFPGCGAEGYFRASNRAAAKEYVRNRPQFAGLPLAFYS